MSVTRSTAGRSPLIVVARTLLSQRFGRLRRAVRRCRAALDEPEPVHQVRVATRRMDAALSLFGPLLAPRRARKFHKRLRRLRRAARDVRDCDVLLERFADESPPDPPAAEAAPESMPQPTSRHMPLSDAEGAALVAGLRGRRSMAADALVAELDRFSRRRLKQRFRKLRRSLCWRMDDTEPGFREGLGRLAAPALIAFEQAGERELSDVGALHEFRLAGKRLRYTLELLGDAAEGQESSSLEEWLKSWQQQLGTINDHATAASLLAGLTVNSDDDGVRCAAERLASAERSHLEDGVRAFANWWRASGHEEAKRALAMFRAGWQP